MTPMGEAREQFSGLIRRRGLKGVQGFLSQGERVFRVFDEGGPGGWGALTRFRGRDDPGGRRREQTLHGQEDRIWWSALKGGFGPGS